jgi:hypothetical protein
VFPPVSVSLPRGRRLEGLDRRTASFRQTAFACAEAGHTDGGRTREVRSTLRGPGGFFHTNLNIIEPDVPLGAPSHVGYRQRVLPVGRPDRTGLPDCTAPQG